MKKVVAIFLIYLSNIPVFGQNIDFQWAKSMGGSGTHFGNSIAVDAIGNVYTTGYFVNSVDFDPGIGVFTLTSVGGNDVFIQKMDPNGNFLWAKSMGGTSDDEGLGISVDNQGNVYTTGSFNNTADFNPSAGVSNLNSAGLDDIFIHKLSTNGDFLWVKHIGGSATDNGNSIHIDVFGNILLTGMCSHAGNVDFDPGPAVFNLPSDQSPIFVLKLDQNGNFIWVKGVDGITSNRGSSVSTDAAGNVYSTGFFTGTSDFDPGQGTFNLTSASADVYIWKLNSNGNFEWARNIESTGVDNGKSISVSPSGNVYVTGEIQGTADLNTDAGSQLYTSNGGRDVFILKLDTDGNFEWGKAFGGTNIHDTGAGIVLDASENVYVTGSFQNTVDFDLGSGNQILTAYLSDMYILKLGLNGNFIWVKRAESGSEYSHAIAVDESGSIYSTGFFFGTTDFDPSSAVANITAIDQDIFVLKLSACQVAGTDVQSACGSYTWIDNITYNSSNTTATHTIVGGAVNGCDSLVTLNLTINQPTSSTISETACGSYTWTSGNGQTYNSSTTATHVIQNVAGCDSTITLNLTINQPTSATISETACGSYTWTSGNGQTYTSSTTATHIIQNAVGCDSTITLNLTINNVDNTVSVNGITLTANQIGATYKWLDCNNGNAPISGATAQSFTPTVNGSHAVEVTANGCTEISACELINTVGTEQFEQNEWNVYPNPNNGIFTITTIKPLKDDVVEVYSAMGQLVYKNIHSGNEIIIRMNDQPNGVYLLKLNNQQYLRILKL